MYLVGQPYVLCMRLFIWSHDICRRSFNHPQGKAYCDDSACLSWVCCSDVKARQGSWSKRAAAGCLQVVWRLADPPQRSAARKALASASNVVFRQPGRAGWQGSKFVTMRGVAQSIVTRCRWLYKQPCNVFCQWLFVAAGIPGCPRP
jgi:hypothetical protein